MSAPSPEEQLILEFVNRARADPEGELARMVDRDTGIATTPEIQAAIDFFGVDMEELYGWFFGILPSAPLAWDTALGASAEAHSQLMIDFDQQSHNLPGEPSLGDRITAAGYVGWNALAENVFAYAIDPFYGHAGFYIDWGDGLFGIQEPPLHRIVMLATTYTDVGIGWIPVTDPSLDIGPNALTQHFGRRPGDDAKLTGVVIDDADGDAFYDSGEGLGGVTVTATGAGGTYSTLTWASGGYTLAVPDGEWTVTFSGGALAGEIARTASVSGSNVKIDAFAADAVPPAVPVDGLLWRRADGTVDRVAPGGAVETLGGAGIDWSVVALADLSGDGRSDLLWRRDDGATFGWLLDASGLTASGGWGVVGPEWDLLATPDLDGDGRDDILWRRDDGALFGWLMDGLTVTASGSLGTLPTVWQLDAVADIDGDGRDDLLWRNETGTLYGWRMDGLAIGAQGTIATVGTDWQVAGTPDLDADGRADVLWRNDTGALYVQLLDGTGSVGQGGLGSLPSTWTIVGTPDLVGDGGGDILWRNISGELYFWEMEGVAIRDQGSLGNPGPDVSVIDLVDTDGDGRDDIQFRDPDSGAVWSREFGSGVPPAQVSFGLAEEADIYLPDIL